MTTEQLPGTTVTLERDVPAAMRDGTVLRADVYRPEGDGPVPVLLLRSPYGKTVNIATFGNAHPVWFARHGYMVVIQDTRGRYASDGEFYPFPYHGEGSVGLGKPLKIMTHPLRADLPIFIGAEGPKNVTQTAEIADGWLPLYYSPFRQDVYADQLQAAKPGFEINAVVTVSITDDVATAVAGRRHEGHHTEPAAPEAQENALEMYRGSPSARLLEDVARANRNVNASKWFAAAATTCTAIASVAFGAGYWLATARSENEALRDGAVFATPEGRAAARLAELGQARTLLECSGVGWTVKDGYCYGTARDGDNHWTLRRGMLLDFLKEQDADLIMFLYRPEYYGIKTTPEGHSTKGLAEVIVGKQRNGPTGARRLFFVENWPRGSGGQNFAKTPRIQKSYTP